MVKTKALSPAKLKEAKLVPWRKVVPLSVFKLSKGSRAGVVLDKEGIPQLFIFDTFALLDILSTIDEAEKKGWIPFSKIQAELGLA